jgi:hypothetical protein
VLTPSSSVCIYPVFIISKVSWFTKLISNIGLAFRYYLTFLQIGLIWLNKAVKLLSILINTLWIHRCSAFTKDLPVIKIRVAHLFSVLCSPIMCLYVLGSVLWFPHTNDVWFILYLQMCVRGLMSYKRYLCWLADSGVQHTLCSFFACFCLVFILCLVWHALPISMDCPFCVTTSVFSIVYWH